MQTDQFWMGVGGRGVQEGEDLYFPLVILCHSLFLEVFLPQTSIASFSYFYYEQYHTYRGGHKMYVCSTDNNCSVSPNVTRTQVEM